MALPRILTNRIVIFQHIACQQTLAPKLTSAKTTRSVHLCCGFKLPNDFKFPVAFKMIGIRKPMADKRVKPVLMDVNVSRAINTSSNSTSKNINDQKTLTIAVEGNIGSGKTTLLEYFQKSPNVEAIKEPLEQWTNVQGYNALGLLYEDPTRWSFSFNMYASLTRVQMHTSPSSKPIKMLERSLHSTRYCFVENDYRNKTITGLEHAIVTEWFDWLKSSQKIDVDLIVYVRCSPEICYERVRQRARDEESGVPKKLIDDLHNLHEEWLIDQTYFKAPAPVLILDANKDYDYLTEEYEIKREEILCGYS